MQKKVLVLYYSQSGQLKEVLNSIVSGIDSDATVTLQEIKPTKEFPYPWKFFSFFDIFPECVYMDGCEVNKLNLHDDYDLILLGYQPWFLSPSLPISGFLKTDEAKRLFKNKPIITIIACRNMWIMAQEKIKKELSSMEATLIDNVVLIDQGHSLATFITTTRWMFTGKKDRCCGVFPQAGIAEGNIKNAARFGKAIGYALKNNQENAKKSILTGLGAVEVDEKIVKSEEIGHKSFLIWGKIIKKLSNQNSAKRKTLLVVYISFLVTLIVTVVPINMSIQYIIRKIRPNMINAKKRYYEEPSGSGKHRLKEFS